MVKRLESHHPGKIRIWTGVDRSCLYEIYNFLPANKDETADEQGGEIDTPSSFPCSAGARKGQ